MDSFEINKIVAAVLLVALLVIGIGKLSNVIFYVEKPEKPSMLQYQLFLLQLPQ